LEQQGLTPWADNLTDITHGTPDRRPSLASFDGATRAFQIDNHLDPDGIALPGGPTDLTRRALAKKTALKTVGHTPAIPASFTQVREPVGPDQTNRPDDVRSVRRILKRTGFLPAFAQNENTHQAAGNFTPAVAAGIRAWQIAKKTLKPDAIIRSNGPTEESMIQQVGRAAARLRSLLDNITNDLIARAKAGDTTVRGVTNGQTARTLAGSIVGRAAEKAQVEKFGEVQPFLASLKSDSPGDRRRHQPILLAQRGGGNFPIPGRGPVRAPEKGDGGGKAPNQNQNAGGAKKRARTAGSGDLPTGGTSGSRGSSKPGIKISADQANFPVRLKNQLNFIQNPELRNRLAGIVRGGELTPRERSGVTEIVQRGTPEIMAIAEWKSFLLRSGLQPPEPEKIPWRLEGDRPIYATRINPNLTITLRQPIKDQDWTIEVVIHHLGKTRTLKIRYR
jgi:hypothetical protein